MIRNQIAIFFLIIAAVVYGCAGITGEDAYFNDRYQINPRSATKVAIVPLTRLGPGLPCTGKCPPLDEVTDQYFEESFRKMTSRVVVIPMNKSRAYFGRNISLLNSLLDITYSKQELRNDPNLKSVLALTDLSSFREQLGDADLLLVPAKFDLGSVFGHMFGNSEFRLYDLYTGSLIYSTAKNFNVNRTDEAGRGLIAIILIGEASRDFDKYYLKRKWRYQ
jgi:hypothetical protein